MEKIQLIKKKSFLKKIGINLVIITVWFTGVLSSYFLFKNLPEEMFLRRSGYYAVILCALSLLMLLFSSCVFYLLFNNTYERRMLEKNIRALEYITMGLERLNERIILINVENGTYEFIYVGDENECTGKSGPYQEFIFHLLDDVEKESDRQRLNSILSLEHLTKRLTPGNPVFTIQVELNVKGSIHWDLLSFIGIQQNESRISKILLFRNDVTDAQIREVEQQQLLADALQQAESANKAKSTFLFNMSHDIRTPMNAIIGFTEMAKKYLEEPEKAEDYLNKVNMASRHMLHIVNDVLDMARIDSGKVELESAPIDIYKECHASDALFRSAMEEKQIEFEVTIDIMDAIVLGDAVRLKQIVVNLIDNALKYTKPGGKVSVHYLQTEHTADGFACYEISVKDTGIGMSEEYQHHLFEAFERERSATVSGIQGTGLGLAISKRIADLMGATLTCNSKLGAGTEFILRFKLPAAGKTIHADKENMDISAFKDKRVLLVEDNDLNREIAVEMLEELGFLVEEANDGSVAVEKIRNSRPGYYQFVFMDIQMPYMDGYQSTHTIRMLADKELATIPIIAMTANAFDEDRQKALDAGMNAHLSKPIDISKIIETLRQFI